MNSTQLLNKKINIEELYDEGGLNFRILIKISHEPIKCVHLIDESNDLRLIFKSLRYHRQQQRI